MIDVRCMVPIVRKEDSSNHSHDHTHDHYHRRPAVLDDSSDHSLPQLRAFLHTHDRSHLLVWLPLGRKDVVCLESVGTRWPHPTEPCPVDDAIGLSARSKAYIRVSRSGGLLREWT
jgi:hypothetical protein